MNPAPTLPASARLFRGILLAMILASTAALPLAACTDGDIRRGCEQWCKCQRGDRNADACRSACEEILTHLKKQDRARARQVADCLAAKGKRACRELVLCGQGVLK